MERSKWVPVPKRDKQKFVERQSLVESLNKDAIISFFVPAWVLEHIVRIVEESK